MARIKIRLKDISGNVFYAEDILSFEMKKDISAPCDGLSLSFLSGGCGEINRVEVISENGLVFSGLCDTQREERAGGLFRVFLYARSSACVLTDNEAQPCVYDSPTARSLFLINAEKYGFKFDMEDVACSGKYAVQKGCSCFCAINSLVSVCRGKNIIVTPDGRLTLSPGNEVFKIDSGSVTAVTKITSRGAPLERIDYKTAGEDGYSRHIKSRTVEELEIKRSKKLNLSALFDWQRSYELKNAIKTAASNYKTAAITLEGTHFFSLYSKIDFRDSFIDDIGEYRISSVRTVSAKNGEKTVIGLFKEIEPKEIMYVD